MPLKITPKTEPIHVDQIVVAIYGVPGLGKTTLASTARAPLLLDFDQGAHRAALRVDTVQVESWGDVSAIGSGDLEAYDTVVVDTAGRALDCLTTDIIRRDPKMGRGGALTLQGYGQLKSQFIAFTKLLRSFGKDVVLVAHSVENMDGDSVIERLDMQGASKSEVYKSADAMARLYIENGKRVLNFSPTDTSFGKNPGQLEPLLIPATESSPHFLAEVIEKIKANLNALTDEQQAIMEEMQGWHAKLGTIESLDDLNAVFKDAGKNAHDSVKQNVWRLIKAQGKAMGCLFDNDAGAWILPAAEPGQGEELTPEEQALDAAIDAATETMVDQAQEGAA